MNESNDWANFYKKAAVKLFVTEQMTKFQNLSALRIFNVR